MVKRHLLSSKDIKNLVKKLPKQLVELVNNVDNVEYCEVDEKLTIYLLNNKPGIAYIKNPVKDIPINEIYIPLLPIFYFPEFKKPEYPWVRVDDGAVPRIINGADIMRPGIKEFYGNFKKFDIVLVKDFKNRIIAIGLALNDKEVVEKWEKGKVLKNIHYIGDKIWKICEELVKKK